MSKRSKIPYFLAIFFAIIVIVNIYYIMLSKNSFNGVIIDNSYNKGLQYNQTIAKKEEQELLGWKINVKIKQEPGNKKRIFIELLDKNSNKVKGAKIFIKFIRPTYQGIDFSKNFIEKDLFYENIIKFPALGNWDFEIFATKDDNNFITKRRFVIHNFEKK